ncbi:uncharacterized protein LOC130669873 [Microplitis mediator]|uniref:uncharacterized protein LOC130669873 n=1 Tax=Microplitis mediator TaxID=375433 RepID=UPI002557100E|nr:uncharacterized protein LOC130669873 [Microplitis mediator]
MNMSINSDSSQLSGLSGISNLSCSSSMYLTTKIKTKELSLNKILEALAKCEESMYQIAHRKLIYKSLENIIADNNNLKPELLDKLKQIILANKINKYLVLPNDSNEKCTLLGIMETPKPEFNCEERRIIKFAVETEVLKSINSFISKYEEYGGNLIEAMGTKDSIMKQQLSEFNKLDITYWKDKIDDTFDEYQRHILICAELLEEWLQLKHEDVENFNSKKAKSKLLEAEILEIQTKIMKIKYTISMFTETSITLDAFKIINQKLDDKLDEILLEIKKKKILSKQYQDLRGTEYDDILKRYLELRFTIEKEERLLNSL